MLRQDILIGLALIGLIILVIVVIVGILLFMIKAVGVLLIIGGVVALLFFPDILGDTQPEPFSKTGIMMGIIMIIIGLLILIYM